jgi:hypothetical protein
MRGALRAIVVGVVPGTRDQPRVLDATDRLADTEFHRAHEELRESASGG